MISKITQQKLQQLYAGQGTYQPTPAIRRELASKNIVLFIGATCEGKNTVMRAVAAADPQFKVIGTFTSRLPREDDTPGGYTYYENSDEGLRELLARIDRHEVVQYAVNPHAHLVYGSEMSDYSSEFGLCDVFASAVASFRQLGFKQAVAITIITEPAAWLERFELRFPPGHSQRQARRDEAIDSFNWSLAQLDNEHFWIENVDGEPAKAGQEIVAISHGTSHGQPAARKLAVASLQLAKAIQS